jgi:hypothetical protein
VTSQTAMVAQISSGLLIMGFFSAVI